MSEPRDAAAIILVKGDEVLLAQRNPALAFLGGWHAFPGGKLDKADSQILVNNCQNIDLQRFIVCAVRELFEEVGVLIVRGGDKLTKGQLASLHDDLISQRSSFAEILAQWELTIDADDFQYAGFWTTPHFSPVRFKTRFFLSQCPVKQTPYQAISEMQDIKFVIPRDALDRWRRSEILISPPVLVSLEELSVQSNSANVVANLREKSSGRDGIIDYLETNSRIIVFPLKTKTLPPATHTNCFIIGHKEFIVIDAASPDTEEQRKLSLLVDKIIGAGGNFREIVVSHYHNDHHGGEVALRQFILEKHGIFVPISTHRLTAERLPHIKFDRFIDDGEVYHLRDGSNQPFELKTLHTPGHTRGLLAFYDAEYGFLISTDNVVAQGSVVIAPPEGNMSEYLATLNRLAGLPNLRFLCGSHGSAVFDAKGKIKQYIEHRLKRERQIIAAIDGGAETAEKIVEKLYGNLSPDLIPIALLTVKAHLERIRA